MNIKQKSMLAGGLGALATFVWVPQVLSRGDDESRTVPEVPAEQTFAEGVAPALSAASATAEVAAADAQTSVPREGAESEQGAALTRLSTLEASLEALTEESPGLDLGALFARLDQPPHAGQGAPLAAAVELSEAGRGPRAWLAEFAAQNPLTGLIHGPDRALALLGHRIVQPGDTLLGGKLTVVAIESSWIELATEGASLRVELPAFRARGGPSPSVAPAGVPPAGVDSAQPSEGGT